MTPSPATDQVSVLLPFHNAESYLGEAIESVLAQTHREFELILIDDGSRDGSTAIAESYAAQDERIKILRHANCGMGDSLNRGMEIARHDWIVRMDADDVMLPERIERQLDFVRRNPDVAVASSFVIYINAKGRVIGKSDSQFVARETVSDAVRNHEVVGFTHPAVIMRKSVIQAVGGYRKQFWPADDVDLWNRVVETGAMVLVQPEGLLKYRIHEGSVSVKKAFFADRQVRWIKECLLARRNHRPEPTEEEFERKQAARPLAQKVQRYRKSLCKAHYKAGVAAWANGSKVHALLRAAAAGCLSPKFLLGRLKTRSLRT